MSNSPLHLVKTFIVRNHVAKVYRDTDWNEYRVKFVLNGTPLFPDADYHTDDRQDALETAQSFVIKASSTD